MIWPKWYQTKKDKYHCIHIHGSYRKQSIIMFSRNRIHSVFSGFQILTNQNQFFVLLLIGSSEKSKPFLSHINSNIKLLIAQNPIKDHLLVLPPQSVLFSSIYFKNVRKLTNKTYYDSLFLAHEMFYSWVFEPSECFYMHEKSLAQEKCVYFLPSRDFFGFCFQYNRSG